MEWHCHTRMVASAACVAALAGFVGVAQGQLPYSENFDTDPSASWNVNTHPNPADPSDFTADFAFDYSTIGIPEAPNSTGATATTGLKLQANLEFSTLLGAVSVSPAGLDISGVGDFTMTFDVWSNFNGPFPGGGSGSTNLSTYGVLTSGTSVNRPGVTDGVWFANTGDGGSGADWRVYSAAQPASHQADDRAYVAPDRNNINDFYSFHFPGMGAPAAQVALFSQQSGLTADGAGGMRWNEVTIVRKTGLPGTPLFPGSRDVLIWRMNGILIAVLDTTDMVLGGGTILFGHSDINTGSSADPNRGSLLFTLIDNVEIVAGAAGGEPTGACCQPDGTCAVMTDSECHRLYSRGAYQGDGVACIDAVCAQAGGACCLFDGTCALNLSETECFGRGFFQGVGTTGCVTCNPVNPPNDDCSGAELIASMPAVVTGDTSMATRSVTEGCLNVTDGAFGDVWYRVVGTGNGIIATTCPGVPSPTGQQTGDFNVQVRVFSGTCGALVCEAANFDAGSFGCNQQVRVRWDSLVGEDYYILISGFANDPGGAFTMEVFEDLPAPCCLPQGICQDLTSADCAAQNGTFVDFGLTCADGVSCPDLTPPNDDCVNAQVVFAGGVGFVNNVFADLSGADGSSACAPSSKDVWFSFTPNVSGPYTLDTVGTIGTNDTVMDIYEGGCAGSLLYCDDDGASVPGVFHAEAKDLMLQAGVNYRIRVAVFGTGAGGDIQLFLSPDPFVEGACCDASNVCTVTTEAACTSGGGTYLGDFTQCDNDLELREKGSALLDLGFDFDFFGTTRTDVVVAADGYLTFKDDGSDSRFGNTIPGDGVTNPLDVIAPFWDNYDPETAGSVHAATVGSGVDQRFIAHWNGVPQAGNVNSYTFQAVLFQNGTVEFRYGDIVEGTAALVGVASGTAGRGFAGTQVTDNFCVVLTPDGLGSFTVAPCANAIEDITTINPCDIPPPVCPCEFDGVPGVNVFDLLAYLDLWFPAAAGADIDGTPGVNVFDLLFFLDCWFPASAGNPCP